MERIVEYYDRGKFEECIDLLKKLPENRESLIEKLITENCINVCQSLIVIISCEFDKLDDTQETLFLFYQKIISLGSPKQIVPLELELVAEFNFLWWIWQYGNKTGDDEAEIEQHLQIINNGLIRGKGHKIRECVDTAEEILMNMKFISSVLFTENYKTSLLLLETIVVSLLYVLKISKIEQIFTCCSEVISVILPIIDTFSQTFELIEDEEMTPPIHSHLLKFSLSGIRTTVKRGDKSVVDYLAIIEAVNSFLTKNFQGSLKSFKKSSKTENLCLWHYLAAISSFYLGDLNKSLGYLLKVSPSLINKEIRSRYLILNGRIFSKKGNHKEALRYFSDAKDIDPTIVEVYYYLGQEFGKMGLCDMMIENFEEMIKILHEKKTLQTNSFGFEQAVLSWMHPPDGIDPYQAHYVLAVSYGLNEMFQQSTEIFEKILQLQSYREQTNKREIISPPNSLTVFHEASAMNLLTGNLTRAEQLCCDAMDNYVPSVSEHVRESSAPEASLVKDVKWLRSLISTELGLGETLNEPDITYDIPLFSEENVRFFEEDIIGLLLHSEIQRMQESDDYRTSISKIFSIYSKYLSKMQKKADLTEKEKVSLTLVKALAAKTCLNIAKCQLNKGKSDTEIDKTFKRALTCNKGDKDVLFHYAQFLINSGKSKDAYKLWTTFYHNETVVSADQCESLALRYLLSTHVTKRELNKMLSDIESVSVGFT